MRIIFLNCYSGHLKEKLFEFINKERINTDLFCFQEVSVSLQNELQETLHNFSTAYEIGFFLFDCNELAGQSIFYNNKIKLLSSEKILLHELKTTDIGFLLKLKLEIDKKELILGNVHGTADPGDKLDSETRINQSKKILKAFENETGSKIIGGDFNLLRSTKSIKMFKDSGYKNLNLEYKIEATRNEVAWKRFINDPGFVKQFDSDYCFCTDDIKVNNFKAINIEISDHMPLILDFEI